MKIKLHMQGWADVEVDRAKYGEARDAHLAGDTGRIDKLLCDAISGMDTEVTVTEPDGTEYDL